MGGCVSWTLETVTHKLLGCYGLNSGFGPYLANRLFLFRGLSRQA